MCVCGAFFLEVGGGGGGGKGGGGVWKKFRFQGKNENYILPVSKKKR